MTNSTTLHHGWITDLPVAEKSPELATCTVRARVGLLSHHFNRFLDQLEAISCDRRLIALLEEPYGEAPGGVVGAFDEPRNDL